MSFSKDLNNINQQIQIIENILSKASEDKNILLYTTLLSIAKSVKSLLETQIENDAKEMSKQEREEDDKRFHIARYGIISNIKNFQNTIQHVKIEPEVLNSVASISESFSKIII